ncbi:MAG: preprotein translocase subunit SecY [Candidatus Pacebacteria bacterium]|nr:preprotein translocase subunit SecY [Candidatus Paceibacterota bacterium]
MLDRFLSAWKIPEIRNKIAIIAGLLVAFRVMANIPLPGIDHARLIELFSSNQLLGYLNVFSGGALSNLSIVMLGVGPYITATIVMQLLTMVFPTLKVLYYEEGAMGRAKFNRYSMYLTIPLGALQSYGLLNLLNRQGIFTDFNSYTIITNVIIATAGSMMLVWIGNLISKQKIGNGVSLIIFAGIVSRLPQDIQTAIATYDPTVLVTYAAFIILSLVIIAAVVFVTEGERKVAVSYAKRVRGNKMFGGVSTYLPLRVNQAGVMPIIFAISLMLFPQFFAQVVSAFSTNVGGKINEWVSYVFNNGLIYGALYFILVVVFTFFYTMVTFDPKEISKNLQQAGGFIPGIRPGEPTTIFLSRLLNRITFFGAVFLGFVAVLPNLTQGLTGIERLSIGGTALLIVVSVALETMKQIDSQLIVREYDSQF